jgi:hypothetical protein
MLKTKCTSDDHTHLKKMNTKQNSKKKVPKGNLDNDDEIAKLAPHLLQ